MDSLGGSAEVGEFAESLAIGEEKERKLGLTTGAALVVASMVGVGVFTTSGFLLNDLGSPYWALLAWLVGGIQATLGALCYGALASRIPKSGGEYVFLSRTLHPAAGYLAGWISLLVGFSAPLAMAAYGFGDYTREWFPDFGGRPLVASLLIIVFAVAHSIHVGHGASLQNMAVILKVALILLFIGFAVSRLDIAGVVAANPAAPPFSGKISLFAVSLVWISFSYSGWNAAVYIGGEIREPRRNLPRSLLLGAGVVTLLYLALNAIFVFSAPISVLTDGPNIVRVGRTAAMALGGQFWAEAITAIIALGLATSVSSLVMAGSRVFSQMARDGYLPRPLGAVPGQPPRLAIIIQTGIAMVMLWTACFTTLLSLAGFTLSLCAAATVLGLVKLKLKEGDSLWVPGWPWVPGLFLASVAAMLTLSLVKNVGGNYELRSVLIVVGLLIWGWMLHLVFYVGRRGGAPGR